MCPLYNEYLTGAEREAAIMVAESDAQIARLNVLFETVNNAFEANLIAAEAKVFAENGTYDDLTELYREAAEEATEKKQGVLTSVVSAISNLFSKIINFITSKFGKGGSNVNSVKEEEFKVDKSVGDKFNIIKKGWDVLKGSVDKIKAGSFDSLGDIASAWGPIVAAGGAISATGTAIVVKRNVILGWIKSISDDIVPKVNAAITSLRRTLGIAKVAKAASGNDSEQSGESKSLVSKITDKVMKILNGILNALKWIGNQASTFLGTVHKVLFKNSGNKDESVQPEEVEGGVVYDTDDESHSKPEGSRKKLPGSRRSSLEMEQDENVKSESTSIFGYDLGLEDTFYETEMSKKELFDLSSLFNEC